MWCEYHLKLMIKDLNEGAYDLNSNIIFVEKCKNCELYVEDNTFPNCGEKRCLESLLHFYEMHKRNKILFGL